MPCYRYRCLKCKIEYEVVHPVNEERHACEQCKDPNGLMRVPALIRIGKTPTSAKQAVGTLVQEHIEQSKRELEIMKRELQQEYKPGN